MHISLCKAKIHRATVTEACLAYEGSLTVDKRLLEAVGIVPYEKVLVVNVDNGMRFETYIIEGESGSGVICLNGAAARLGQVGDKVIIIAFALFEQKSLPPNFQPAIAYLNEANQITELNREFNREIAPSLSSAMHRREN